MFRYLSKRIKISTFSFLSIIFLFSCMSKQIVIKPLHPYQYYQNDTIIEGQKIGNDLTQYYYIENYSHDSSKIQKLRISFLLIYLIIIRSIHNLKYYYIGKQIKLMITTGIVKAMN